ncbi:MAG: uridine diphosphate-N-acetylglucosamine-binding protein YvcK [Actinomycetota bacterium]|nr:uridine diphosphate-N-acetylglucosamine-binding protein YvcK [Actinomycetota bacterium]
MTSPSIVALGGGHGLAVTLAAARQLTPDVTAIVTVADDGGSSGQIRRELDVVPPGDLRMALAALAGSSPGHSEMATLLQHRFGGNGALAGHPVGNLLLTGLMEVFAGDCVRALDTVGGLIGAVGRVLPMSTIPLDITAWVEAVDDQDPLARTLVRGQVAVATSPGRVRSVQLVPAAPPACAEALSAIGSADIVLLGPGSWFTSVLPHLLVPDLLNALQRCSAQVIVVLNLTPQAGETDGFSPQEHLSVLRAHAPELPIGTVLADASRVVDRRGLLSAVQALRIDGRAEPQLLIRPVANKDSLGDQHDPRLLAEALAQAIESALPARTIRTTRTEERPAWP